MKPLHALLLTVCMAAHFVSPAYAKEATPLPIESIENFTRVYLAVKDYYVDSTTDRELFQSALKGLLEGLDPHSTFLDEKAFKELNESTTGEFGGLGIEVTMDPTGVLVIAPIDDTPASKAGVRAGDIIIKLDNEATNGLTLLENTKRMRGQPGTKIHLTIARKGLDQPLEMTLVRSLIKVKSVKSKRLKGNIGYIRLSRFNENTVTELAKATQSLAKGGPLKGLVLDLRNNPGGLLNAAVGVCAVFLPQKTKVVEVKGRGTPDQVLTTADYPSHNEAEQALIAKIPALYKTVPIAVLVNAATASASEIVSGALQDHKRATILGQLSFGKGSVQTVLPLPEANGQKPTTGIKLTTARYYTPSGRSIQAKGIVPDIEVTDTEKGNFPTFGIREVNLANHLTAGGQEPKDAPKPKQKPESREIKDFKPSDWYHFGDKKDYPLRKATEFLLQAK